MDVEAEISDDLQERIEEAIEDGTYNSRAELVRTAVWYLLHSDVDPMPIGEPLSDRERERIRKALEEGGSTPHEEVMAEFEERFDRDPDDG